MLDAGQGGASTRNAAGGPTEDPDPGPSDQSLLEHPKAFASRQRSRDDGEDGEAGENDENDAIAERRAKLKVHIEKLLKARNAAFKAPGAQDLVDNAEQFYAIIAAGEGI